MVCWSVITIIRYGYHRKSHGMGHPNLKITNEMEHLDMKNNT